MFSGIEWKKKGNEFFAAKKFDEAVLAYENGIKVSPEIPELWYNKGLSLHNLNRLEEAAVSYRKALELRPDYEKARERLLSLEKKAVTVEPLSTSSASLFVAPSLIKILSFSKPGSVFYGGKEMGLDEVEGILGKSFTSTLTIPKTLFEDYMRYSHNEIVCNFLKESLDLPKPLDYSYFDIVNYGEYGHGIVARKPVRKGTVVGYYVGDVVPISASASSYSLGLCNDASSVDAHFRYNIDLVGKWSFMSLLQHLPQPHTLSEEYEVPEASRASVATANIQWDTINLFTEGPERGAAVVVMFVSADILPGQLVGFDYRPGYWVARKMEPVLFDMKSHSPIAGVKFKGIRSARKDEKAEVFIQTLGDTAKAVGQSYSFMPFSASRETPALLALSLVEIQKRGRLPGMAAAGGAGVR